MYGGVLPAPAINGTDLDSLTAALAAYPEQLSSWIA